MKQNLREPLPKVKSPPSFKRNRGNFVKPALELVAQHDKYQFTTVKQQWATLVLGWVAASVHYSYLYGLCTHAFRPTPLSALFLLLLLMLLWHCVMSAYFFTEVKRQWAHLKRSLLGTR